MPSPSAWIARLRRTLREFYRVGPRPRRSGSRLLSERQLAARIEFELARARRYQRPLSLIRVRLESRVTRDETRSSVSLLAARFADALRETDVAGWVDHDHVFVLLLPECGADAAERTGKRIRRGLAPYLDGDMVLDVSEYPRDGWVVETLLAGEARTLDAASQTRRKRTEGRPGLDAEPRTPDPRRAQAASDGAILPDVPSTGSVHEVTRDHRA